MNESGQLTKEIKRAKLEVVNLTCGICTNLILTHKMKGLG